MRSVAAILALVACVHAGLWALLQRQATVPEFKGQLASVSYSPYVWSAPESGDRPTVEQIRADLKRISPYTRAIRTYKSTGGIELVPLVAAEFGLKVTLGIWISEDEARNEREIRSALDLARRYTNVNAIVVGNEVTLRTNLAGDEKPLRAEVARIKATTGDPRATKHSAELLDDLKAEKSAHELIKIIQRVKRQSPVPVTTGEIWRYWIKYPELASAVDFIAAHILPYWEELPEQRAVEYTLSRYGELRQTHPGKHIVIAEFGWPSGGYNKGAANPGCV